MDEGRNEESKEGNGKAEGEWGYNFLRGRLGGHVSDDRVRNVDEPSMTGLCKHTVRHIRPSAMPTHTKNRGIECRAV